jgi:hypothetical protein
MEDLTQALQKQQEQQPLASLSQMQNSQTYNLSVWRQEPPATPEYIQQWMATLGAAFPNTRPEFWAIVGKMVRKDGLSRKRLAYIGETLCRTWKYPTLQVADILSIDKTIKIWHYYEFVKEFKTTNVSGYCILKQRASDGRIQFCVTADAETAGLEIQQKFE